MNEQIKQEAEKYYNNFYSTYYGRDEKKRFIEGAEWGYDKAKNDFKQKIRDWIDAQKELNDKDLDTLLIAMGITLELIDKPEVKGSK